ncbi:hypothetical protein MKEN_00472800 [Mycena kentingensis (nom. inval.)]|nr:hypothetical protein MKEN_00472800 [Mycena kentingensis (nom. inval.)]
MPPGGRPESVRSWWSDSNPLLSGGPTLNLHTLAKPLMRRMYDREAQKTIDSMETETDLTEERFASFMGYLARVGPASGKARYLLSNLLQNIQERAPQARNLLHSLCCFQACADALGEVIDASSAEDTPVEEFLRDLLNAVHEGWGYKELYHCLGMKSGAAIVASEHTHIWRIRYVVF